MYIYPGGLLSGVSYLPSPNHDERPVGVEVSLIVIHGISLPPNEFGSDAIHQFFLNTLDPKKHPYFESIQHLKVSSHFLIQRHGRITQYVPLTHRAWHAGVSSFDGKKDCNDYSIGIELEGADELPYTLAQYEQLAYLIAVLQQAYPLIKPDCVVGHADIAPGRKTDPGTSFRWELLKNLMIKYTG